MTTPTTPRVRLTPGANPAAQALGQLNRGKCSPRKAEALARARVKSAEARAARKAEREAKA